MRFGRALLAGIGWAATLGGIALCVLVFLSAYVAFKGDRHGVGSRDDAVVRLPSVPEPEVPAVPLARPPGLAGAGGAEGGAASGRTGPRRRSATPRTTTPTPTAPAPGAGGGDPPAGGTPAPAPARPIPSGPGGGAEPASPTPEPPPPPAPPAASLGDTAREITNALGNGVGRISPEAGQVIVETGDTAGDVVDELVPPLLNR